MSEADKGGVIFQGEVVHQRITPTRHRLSYSVFSLFLDVDKLSQTSRSLRFFSVDKFNLFSLSQKQHGKRDGSSLADFAWAEVNNLGYQNQVKKIMVLCYPRILGFAFNPLTVYFCLDSSDKPVLLIYEVRNTFGENLTYVLPAGDAHNNTYTHSTSKRFYVSPFNKVEGDYHFHINQPGDKLTVGVALRIKGKPVLRTHFRGHQTPLSDLSLVKMFFSYPLMTLKVVAGIHWEALRLWRKGMVMQNRPPAPPMRIQRDQAENS